MSRILLIHPDIKWLAKYKKIVEEGFSFQVDIVNNGKLAQKALSKFKYYASVLSLDTQEHPGSMVLNFIKMNYPLQSVVILCKNLEAHFDDVDSVVKEFKKIGINKIYNDDISFQEIKNEIEGGGNTAEEVTDADSAVNEGKGSFNLDDNQFTKVRINEFMGVGKAVFNTYIRLGENKYLKLVHAGDPIDKERINQYKEKGVAHLFFKNQDRKKFINLNRSILKNILNNKKISAKVKVNMTKNITEKMVEEIYIEGLKPHIVEQGMKVADDMYNLISKEKNIYKMLKAFEEFDPSAYARAFLVSLFSNMIVKQFEWESKITTQSVGMASMVLDIGILELPKEFAGLKMKDMTPEQLEEYKKHPILGRDSLSGVPLIKPAVKEIVYQHHERVDGSGFPQGFPGPRIFTLAKIIGIADDFAGLIQDNQINPLEGYKMFIKNPEIVKTHPGNLVQLLGKVFLPEDKQGDKVKGQI